MFSAPDQGRIILYYYTYYFNKKQAVTPYNANAFCKIFIYFFGVFDEENPLLLFFTFHVRFMVHSLDSLLTFHSK